MKPTYKVTCENCERKDRLIDKLSATLRACVTWAMIGTDLVSRSSAPVSREEFSRRFFGEMTPEDTIHRVYYAEYVKSRLSCGEYINRYIKRNETR